MHRVFCDVFWCAVAPQEWTDLFPAVERVPYAAVLMAESLPASKYVDGVWGSDSDEDCPGAPLLSLNSNARNLFLAEHMLF
jgi:hypothetical protein